MAADITELNRAWRRNKSACTRAKNQKDWAKVIEVCDRAFADFDRYGWPDDWAHFEREKRDAEWALAREQGSVFPVGWHTRTFSAR